MSDPVDPMKDLPKEDALRSRSRIRP